jgi:tRNA-2-methylthio-N6-dimethylallyladenosine synthase
MHKKVYIETLGCAMNHKDSENMLSELKTKKNYEKTENLKEADLILINTCSVREKPVSKLFSELGLFKKQKKETAKIGVTGCTASHLGREIISKAPFVDFVLGARNTSKITTILEKKHAVEVDINHDDSQYLFKKDKNLAISKYQSMVNISIGCDKKCSFCIVPATRGTEISIPQNIILDQIKKATENEAKEILLLGQNVNNYGRRFSDIKQQNSTFTKLLREISKIDTVKRIRFTSPHPLHTDDEFFEEFANNPKIAKSIHMPLQSGSTDILKKMRRGYSKEWFLERTAKIRELVADVSISTDIIVGFPTETEADFQDTMEVLNSVKFEQMFSFLYSPRPNTEALKYKESDLIPKDIASQRLKTLQNRHTEILDEIAKTRLNKTYSVYFDEVLDGNFIIGKNSQNHLVRVKAKDKNHLNSLIGTFQKVTVTDVNRTASFGELISE